MKAHNSEVNMLSSKLDTLGDLPADYSPNLDSKWAVLETSLNENQKNRRKFYWSLRIAACLFLTSILSVLYFYTHSEKVILTEKTSSTSLPPLSNEPKSIVRSDDDLIPLKSVQPYVSIVKKTKPIEKNAIVLQQEPAPKQEVLIEPVRIENEALIKEELPIAQSKKKEKRRYIQLDFDDTSPLQKTVPVQSFFTTNFQIRFLKQNSSKEIGIQDQTEAKTIRIKL